MTGALPFDPLLLAYAVPLVFLWAGTIWLSRRRTAHSLRVLEEAKVAGLSEPATLHPVIDPSLCLGCGACVAACPEKLILGLIDGKAKLIEPSQCIGHGACAASCPTDAIQLVFGTETRGVDIPFVSPKFETNVPGIYIAGELGGMGLIRNAIEQGRQAIGNIAAKVKALPDGDGLLDVLIIGAGPAGIAASLGAKERKLKFHTVEQDSLGGTVAHFPRGKVVMTAPAELPLVGKVRFSQVGKEELLKFWEGVVRDQGLAIGFEERVEAIRHDGAQFCTTTSKQVYRSKTILLAIGRRGSPRHLGVPGEELPKVVYRLIDPEQYAGKRVMVVGGGDSALEAAASIAEQGSMHVLLSYRRSAFDRARPKNRNRVAAAVDNGSMTIELNSQVEQIGGDSVTLLIGEERRTVANDVVIICAGGVLPTQLLTDAGVSVQKKFGVA